MRTTEHDIVNGNGAGKYNKMQDNTIRALMASGTITQDLKLKGQRQAEETSQNYKNTLGRPR